MANDPVRERYIISIVLGAAGLITIITLLAHTMTISGVSRFPEAGGQKSTTINTASMVQADSDDLDSSNAYSYWGSGNALLFKPDKKAAPVLVRFGRREYSREAGKDGLYVSFVDLHDKKELRPAAFVSDSDVDVSFRRWGNGHLYFILDDHCLFRIDKNNLQISDITCSVFKKQAKLKSGATQFDFVSEAYGDGLAVEMKNGQTLYYYPRENKVYEKEAVSGRLRVNK